MTFNTVMEKMMHKKVMVLTYISYLLYYHGLVLSSHTAHALRHSQVEEGDAAGFINIDCGNEDDTLLPNYQSDAASIDTGRSIKISPYYISEGTNPVYKTLRSFPHNTRSCYTLKPSKGRGYNYLIRALFMYGNYDRQNKMPTFDIYIGADYMATLSFETTTGGVFKEFMYKPRMDFIYFCLINTGQGTPFISGLFLRPLNSSIYNSDFATLSTSTRYATGFSGQAKSYTSYPNDTYDRFWSYVPPDNFTAWRPYNTSTYLRNIRNDAYEIPPNILKTGVMPSPGKRSLNFYTMSLDYSPQVYFYWHFAEVEKLGENETREFNIFTPRYQLGPFKMKYMKAITVVSPPLTAEEGYSWIWFSINQANTSTHPPILSALEVFNIMNISQATTKEDDVKAILSIKTSYSTVIRGWQGDPCLPIVAWEGLNCTTNDSGLQRIISLDLSSKGLTGEILPSLSGLAALNVLNLSYNDLTGSIPEFLAEMSSLHIIDLTGNKLNGSVPFKLADRVSQGALSLSLDGNPDICTSDPCTVSEKKKKHNVSVSLIASVAASILLLIIIAVAVFCAYKWKRKAAVGITKLKTKNQVFSYSEVVCMTSNFNKILGKGGSGVVYYGCLQDGTPVAVKMLNPSSALAFKLFQTEAQLLVRVHHKNLVSLIGYCEEETCKVLIYEYISNGNLQQHLLEKTVDVLSWKKRLQIAIDTAQGLDYIHSGCKPPIIHRDMKTSNILLNDKMRAKISDFGISREFSAQSHLSTHNLTGEHATQLITDFAGTYGYIDPEYYGTLRLNEKSDVYSFGVVLLELITGRPALVSGANNGEPIYLIAIVTPMLEGGDIYNIVDSKLDGSFSVNAAWKALEIAMACVSPIGIQRPSMNQVLTDLKDCLAIEIAHENGRDAGNNETELSQEIDDNDIVIADIEAKVGPSAR